MSDSVIHVMVRCISPKHKSHMMNSGLPRVVTDGSLQTDVAVLYTGVREKNYK